ncbi:eukaryotic translation initiation factor 4 gamma 1-like [Artemia franciscana]|uniref:MIF4G domain-containing protein n=1 Tax=Artemia franciscana TaxID=6661 RepID=A0AA88H2A0_ARTSF
MRNTGEQLREERDKMEGQRQEEQRQQVRLEEERTLFEEERRKFEKEKRKLKEEAQRKCAEEKHLLEKERARKAKEVEKQMEEMYKRKQDIEKQLHEERKRNETLEVEKEHLRGEQLRLEKELEVFKEEIRKFEQENLELKREAERKYEQEKKLLQEKWCLINAKELIKRQKQFEDAQKLLEKERAEKVEELVKQLEEKNLDFTRDSPGSRLYRIFKESSRDDAIAQAQDLKKAIRGRLNKLTPENYDKISKNILEMEVDTEERLSAMVQIIFDKVVDEPIYAPKYAELCKLMFEKEVPSASGTGKVSFRKLLLGRCQATFEKEKKDEEEILSKQKALEEADTEEKRKELQMELDERIAKTKRIMLGNIRFIGELFKLRMLTIKIMNFCISKLLKSREEEQLECLCILISTIGKTYEEEYDAKYQRAVAESKSSGKQLQIQLTKLDVYLDEMKKLSQSEDLSSHIRFMLMDVLDLKQNRWVPRREGEKPKTIDEIRGELEKERLEKELSLQEDIIKQPQMGYPSQRRDGGRSDEI